MRKILVTANMQSMHGSLKDFRYRGAIELISARVHASYPRYTVQIELEAPGYYFFE